MDLQKKDRRETSNQKTEQHLDNHRDEIVDNTARTTVQKQASKQARTLHFAGPIQGAGGAFAFTRLRNFFCKPFEFLMIMIDGG